MKRVLLVSTMLVLFAVSASAFTYRAWTWSSFRYESTAGIFWDDFDLWTHNLTNVLHDPAALTDVEGYRLYTQLSNYIDHYEYQFGGYSDYGWLIGSSGDFFGYAKYGFVYTRDGWKDGYENTEETLEYAENDPNEYWLVHRTNLVDNYEENWIESGFNLSFARRFNNDLSLGIAFDRTVESGDITGDGSYSYRWWDNDADPGDLYEEGDEAWTLTGEEGISDLEVTVSAWYPFTDDLAMGLQFGYESWKEKDNSIYALAGFWDDNVNDYFGPYDDYAYYDESEAFDGGLTGSSFAVGWTAVKTHWGMTWFGEISYLSSSGDYEDGAYLYQDDNFTHYTTVSGYDFVDEQNGSVYDAALVGTQKTTDINLLLYNNIELVDNVRFGMGAGLSFYKWTDEQAWDYFEQDASYDASLTDSTNEWYAETWDTVFTVRDVTNDYEYKNTSIMLPIGLEFPLHEKFTMRLGARNYFYWTETTQDTMSFFDPGAEGFSYEHYVAEYGDTFFTDVDTFYYTDEFTDFAATYVTKYKDTYTYYVYGARYDVSENLYIDLMGFADDNLFDMQNWRVSAIFKF